MGGSNEHVDPRGLPGVGVPVLRSLWLTLAAAAVTFLLAYDDGSYSLQSRNVLAIAIWWTVVLVLGLRLRSPDQIGPETYAAGGFLALFAAWTGISAAWSNDVESVIAELDRTSLYLGLFVLAVLTITRANLPRVLDGIALGIAAIAALALTSRFLPGVASVPESTLQRLPAAIVRLSYPVGYWNGLGIFVGLGAPLLLRTALAGRSGLGRCLAVGALPLIATTIDLTASRGAAAVALLGVAVFVAATSSRWNAVMAAGAGAIASVVSVAGVHAITPSGDPAGSHQGGAAVIVLAGCLFAFVLYAVWDGLIAPRWEPGPALGWGATALAVLLVLVAVVASHPVRRIHAFKQPESACESQQPNCVRTSFLEGSGSGRWQYWQVAFDEFKSAPLEGKGAGSYETWWAQHANLSRQIVDAHSLYLETMGELGIVGLLLLVGTFGAALVAAVRRLARSPDRVPLAAALGVFVAYLVSAAIDWMWELTVVSLVAVLCFALLVGPATDPGEPEPMPTPWRRPQVRRSLAIAASVLALAAIELQAAPLLGQLELEKSRAASRRSDTATALSRALHARRIEPWASSVYLQLAVVNEQDHDYPTALAWLQKAIDRDSEDWRPWLVAARIQTEAGNIAAARRSLARARELNPRSAIFSD